LTTVLLRNSLAKISFIIGAPDICRNWFESMRKPYQLYHHYRSVMQILKA